MPLASNAFVSYYLIKTTTGKQILLLGDNHEEQMDFINEKHANFFLKFIDSFEYANPIQTLIECGSEAASTFETGKQTDFPLANTFFCFAKYNFLKKFQSKKINLNCVLFDPREIELDVVTNCFTQSEDWLNSMRRNGLIEFPLQDLKNTQEKIRKKARARCTMADYLRLLNGHVDKISKVIEKYKDNEKLFNYLKDRLVEFINAKNQIEEIFKASDHNELLPILILDQFSKCKTVRDANNKLSDLLKIYRDPIEFNYCDIFFLDRMLNLLANDNHIIFLAGDAHIQNMLRAFSAIGCTIVKSQELIMQINGLKAIRVNDAMPFLNNLLNATKQFIADRVTGHAAGCGTCGKTENLKLCSKCKSIKYCSRECQIKDWRNHKLNCIENQTPDIISLLSSLKI